MISRDVGISTGGGGGEMVHGLSLGRFFLFLFSFSNHAFIVLRYKKPHSVLAIERTKPIKHQTYNKGKSRHQ